METDQLLECDSCGERSEVGDWEYNTDNDDDSPACPCCGSFSFHLASSGDGS